MTPTDRTPDALVEALTAEDITRLWSNAIVEAAEQEASEPHVFAKMVIREWSLRAAAGTPDPSAPSTHSVSFTQGFLAALDTVTDGATPERIAELRQAITTGMPDKMVAGTPAQPDLEASIRERLTDSALNPIAGAEEK